MESSNSISKENADSNNTSSNIQSNDSSTSLQSSVNKSLSCPACNHTNRIKEYERFEDYYYSRTSDERREEFPHSSRHDGHYCCEADYSDYNVWSSHTRQDSDPTYYIGKRTNFCYFYPYNNHVAYVCYGAH